MSIRKMSSSANQPVCVGSSRSITPARTQRKPRPADASRYFTVPPVTKSAPSVPHVELDRARRLVAVREHERSTGVGDLGDRGDVVPVARSVRDRRAADERRPLVDGLRKALDGDRAVRLGPHVDDLGAPQLLCVSDLADRGELVLADDDAVAPAALERQRRDDPAHPLGDRGRDGDLVRLAVQQRGEPRTGRLGPLDPELPLGAVLVPPREVLLVGGPDAMREGALRAGVEVDRVLEDRELPPYGVTDAVGGDWLQPVAGAHAVPNP